ncbi:MAG: undecaprenyldiphospho-muramoylpentapeptide beta-N-acetylglucosaminyltransferase [Zoogloeaceae bacterium]|jgi:UDP-N-acetylglucosamine--N-acetylmuramyl-(pentapeptide) pyrophosphoryl-undecaprenol N-acetylglucosamine transferase|nr:undecaprenyldiphospho-muramoylpentapeptide beta-N-acetylglucosaminyltransferase [Zoogloeaceae bacterium]
MSFPNLGPKCVLIMAGGTGGHIFPALAAARVLAARDWKVVWMGNPNSMEDRLVPQHGFSIEHIRFTALRGKGLLRKLKLPLALLQGCSQAGRILSRLQPDVVLGMGGYISFPGGVMAWLKGIPLVVHEQNSIPGLANRALAKLAKRVLSGFPKGLETALWVGNPVRREIAQLPAPELRMAGREGPLNLLVVGGSLGAQVLNEVIPKGLARMEAATRPNVVHQAGEKHLAALTQNYAQAGVQANCVAFIEDMAGAYAWADLVICRAGALTIAELAAAGVASILVPFPFAVDDHQTGNARFLTQAGGAFLLPQAELTPESVALIGNYSRSQLLEMAKKARALARPEAAEAVADMLAQVCKEKLS